MTAIREQVASAVDIIVQQTRFACGSRKITRITEVTGVESGKISCRICSNSSRPVSQRSARPTATSPAATPCRVLREAAPDRSGGGSRNLQTGEVMNPSLLVSFAVAVSVVMLVFFVARSLGPLPRALHLGRTGIAGGYVPVHRSAAPVLHQRGRGAGAAGAGAPADGSRAPGSIGGGGHLRAATHGLWLSEASARSRADRADA